MNANALLAALLLAALVPAAATADEMAFFMKNKASRAVAVELRSRDRDHVWPGDGEVYLLEKGEAKSVPIGCEAGENICYGAWLNGDDRMVWGVGPDERPSLATPLYLRAENHRRDQHRAVRGGARRYLPPCGGERIFMILAKPSHRKSKRGGDGREIPSLAISNV